MVSLNGSSPACRRIPDRLARAWAASLLLGPLLAFAQLPDYARQALTRFVPNMPAGWAYEIETTRGSHQMRERFDPARPVGQQWTMEELDHRPPTDSEKQKYAGSRPAADSGGPKANFQREDIEPGSLKLLQDHADRADYSATFRTAAAESDKMLGHLQLRLTINKAGAYVERYTMELTEPYWPVLGVRMKSLVVTTRFAPPETGAPPLPVELSSDFAGNILLIPVSEQIRVIYSGFQRRGTELSR